MTEVMQQAEPYIVYIIPISAVVFVWAKFDRVYKHLGRYYPDNKLCDEKHKSIDDKLKTIQDDVKTLLDRSGGS